MAAGPAIKYRLESFNDSKLAKIHKWDEVLERIDKGSSRNADLIHIRFEDDFPTTAAELSAPTNLLDGTGTAVVVHVISDNAADNGTGVAGTGCRSVMLFGINEDGLPATKEVLTNVVASVSSVTKFQRILHAIPYTFGSGGAVAGTITITNAAGDTVYLTILAAGVDSDGSTIFIPIGYYAVILSVNLGIAEAITTEVLSLILDIDGYAIPSSFDGLRLNSNVSLLEPLNYIIEQPTTERSITIKSECLGAGAIAGFCDIVCALVPATNELRGMPA
jgi:hypothetical protein